jgi:hypothetical protein
MAAVSVVLYFTPFYHFMFLFDVKCLIIKTYRIRNNVDEDDRENKLRLQERRNFKKINFY